MSYRGAEYFNWDERSEEWQWVLESGKSLKYEFIRVLIVRT
jgi:hypothetical protein